MLDHTIKNNYLIWGSYDWSGLGKEWVPSDEWKQSLLESVFLEHISGKNTILEIGPGAGEWTKELLPYCSKLILMDIVPRCIEICKERFKNFSHIEYFVSDGKSINFIKSGSVDLVFSMNVFIQMDLKTTNSYFDEMARILSKGGIGIIHHSKNGKRELGWRSELNDTIVQKLCMERGLKILEQISSWDLGKFEIWKGQDSDSITVFSKK